MKRKKHGYFAKSFFRIGLDQLRKLKWSGKTGQRAKMYPTLKTGYRNDEETQFFR
jgi:hypothetical protein